MDKTDNTESRKTLIKEALIFQLKLGLDAIRDILLSPVSIILVVMDIVLGNTRKQSYFLKLMQYGRLSDKWINLFNEKSFMRQHRNNSVDYWLAQVETVIKEQQDNGKLSESAKTKIEQYMAQIAKKANKGPTEELRAKTSDE